MSSQPSHVEQDDVEQKQSIWQNIWRNNKGAVLILLAELFGTSMDAIVRTLQQGERGFHPFQVSRFSSKLEIDMYDENGADIFSSCFLER